MLINQDEGAGLSSGGKETGDELGIDLPEDDGRSERFGSKGDVGSGIIS